MEERKDFEDIVSDSSFANKEFEDVFSASEEFKHKKFQKKKHGVAGFFQKIGNGWRSMRVWQRASIITATSLLLVVAIVVGVIKTNFDYNYNPDLPTKPEELGFENIIDEKVVNIALFGIDSRSEGFKGNSDSIMVMSINTETKKIKLVSIVRDSLVAVETKGKVKYRKINSAYATGGPQLAIKTINQNFGLDISEYATVNFYGMAEIIDAVGGVEAELLAGEVVPYSKNEDLLNGCITDICRKKGLDPKQYYIHEPGKYVLNGIQAVAYSRIRKTKNVWGTNNDYGRTDRQRHVMEQLFKKALSLPKSDYVKLVKAMMPHTETSLSYSEIMGLAWDIMLESPTFSQSRVPLIDYQMPGKMIKGVGDCVYYDLDYVTDLLHAYFYDDIDPETYIEQNGVRKNDWYTKLTATNTSSNNSSDTSSDSSSNTSSEGNTSDDVGGNESNATSSDTNNEKNENESSPGGAVTPDDTTQTEQEGT